MQKHIKKHDIIRIKKNQKKSKTFMSPIAQLKSNTCNYNFTLRGGQSDLVILR